MAELEGTENWEKARLIPLRGLKGGTAQEAAATSAVLAVMSIIPSFSHSLLRPLRAPKARPVTYTEPLFSSEKFSSEKDDGPLRPDGLIRVARGGKQWTALVEVKTGENPLEPGQIESYVRLASRESFDAVITISNEFVSPSSPHPVQISKKMLKKVQLVHWSWMHVLTTALTLSRRKTVDDSEQARLLDELIRYLGDERSGALPFDSFGQNWTGIRDAARNDQLSPSSQGIRDFVVRWDQFLRHLSLHMSGELGTQVEVVASREHRKDPAKRTRDLLEQLVTDQQLGGVLRIPDTAADLSLSVDLRASQLRVSVTLKAPEKPKATSRINWLVRQLDHARDTVQVTATFKGRQSTSMSLGEVRQDVRCLLVPDDPRSLPIRFTVAQQRGMGKKTGRGGKLVITSIETMVRDFYHDVIQDLKAWVPPPPKIDPQEKAAESGKAESDGESVAPASEDGPGAFLPVAHTEDPFSLPQDRHFSPVHTPRFTGSPVDRDPR